MHFTLAARVGTGSEHVYALYFYYMQTGKGEFSSPFMR